MPENQSNNPLQPQMSGSGDSPAPSHSWTGGRDRASSLSAPEHTNAFPLPSSHAETAPNRFEQVSFEPKVPKKSAVEPPQEKSSVQPAQVSSHPKNTPKASSPQGSRRQTAVRFPMDVPFERTRLFVLTLVMVPLCIWASYPAWEVLVYNWYHTDDYSHGFIVIPATLVFLYLRLDSYPGTNHKLDWMGLSPILLYGFLRILSGLRFVEFYDETAIWFWTLSIVWFFYGRRVFLWALPSLCFLVFMFPLPWQIDVIMRNRLQMFAAQSGAILLQMAGEVAIPINNIIRLGGDTVLEVERACSGLRFLMSVFAIAFATALLLRRPWWQNIIILVLAAPLALFVNAVRIAITGILLVRFSDTVQSWAAEGQSVGFVADNIAGKITIFLALGLFALIVWYLGVVFKKVRI